jgi:pimeloyl-ACP methyl ester carboxylesterase
MSHPRERKLIEHEEKMLNSATKEILDYKGFSLMRYEWGEDNEKTAYLVHGWEGQTGNFASLIPVLLEANYRVISIDAPSHGNSSIGKTNMFEFSKILISQFEKEEPELVVSHSFGSVNVGKVLRKHPELSIKTWIMVTTPNNFKTRIDELSSKFNLSKKVTYKLIQKIEEGVNEKIEDLNMVNYCSKISNLENAIIIHSSSDKVLPIEGARAVNESFEQSKMIELNNYGHYSILWSEELKSLLKNELEVHV